MRSGFKWMTHIRYLSSYHFIVYFDGYFKSRCTTSSKWIKQTLYAKISSTYARIVKKDDRKASLVKNCKYKMFVLKKLFSFNERIKIFVEKNWPVRYRWENCLERVLINKPVVTDSSEKVYLLEKIYEDQGNFLVGRF